MQYLDFSTILRQRVPLFAVKSLASVSNPYITKKKIHDTSYETFNQGKTADKVSDVL